MGGGDLADRVPREQVGPQAAPGQRLVQGDLQREEGGLGEGGVLESLCRPLPLAKTTFCKGVGRWGSSCSQIASKATLKRGSVRWSSAPISSRWAPWPVSRYARWPSRASARIASGEPAPSAIASRPASSRSRSEPKRAARRAREARPVASE